MSLTAPQIAVGAIALLHLVLMACELFPWGAPKIMKVVLGKWPRTLDLSDNDRHLVAMIVHNAGVYNGIVAAGLFATLWAGAGSHVVQMALLAGGIVAGLVGSVTLSSKTVLQAVAGIIAICVVMFAPA
jgi:putative membrane protein